MVKHSWLASSKCLMVMVKDQHCLSFEAPMETYYSEDTIPNHVVPDAFVFSLKPPANTAPTKYVVKNRSEISIGGDFGGNFINALEVHNRVEMTCQDRVVLCGIALVVTVSAASRPTTWILLAEGMRHSMGTMCSHHNVFTPQCVQTTMCWGVECETSDYWEKVTDASFYLLECYFAENRSDSEGRCLCPQIICNLIS